MESKLVTTYSDWANFMGPIRKMDDLLYNIGLGTGFLFRPNKQIFKLLEQLFSKVKNG
jgi:hypothetical protein